MLPIIAIIAIIYSLRTVFSFNLPDRREGSSREAFDTKQTLANQYIYLKINKPWQINKINKLIFINI
jgi:hypothetical protein